MQNDPKPVRLLTGDRVYLRPLSLDDTETYFHQLLKSGGSRVQPGH